MYPLMTLEDKLRKLTKYKAETYFSAFCCLQRFGFLCLILVGLGSCNERGVSWFELQGNTMGTTYKIRLQAANPNQIQNGIDSVLLLINTALSTYDTNSYISLFNKSTDGRVFWTGHPKAKQYFENVYASSVSCYESTNGAFNPAASTLFSLWGFAEEERSGLPDSTAVLEAMRSSNMTDLFYVNEHGVILKRNPKANLNFNANAKGYGVDVVFDYLHHLGMKDFMIEIGGEVRAVGMNNNAQVWSIGINTPEADAAPDAFIKAVRLNDQAMATSGNYRRYFIFNNKKYSHTIDPSTGYPTENDLMSVSIIARNCMEADAYATACMVLGYEKSAKLISSLPDIKAYFVLEEKNGYQIIEVE
ncbi:MAG: thiamine biosynthesis lipoprotein [Bacteroidia bacterium]|jgi:thiamine biosynthesis lipoprotein